MIAEAGYTLCWAAKWYGEDEIFFDSVYRNTSEGMLENIHKLIDQADAIVHYNGRKFDMPTLNREFITHEFTPPSPYKQIDLYRTVRDQFNFPSNKLDYVAERLGCSTKYHHRGFQLWHDCMHNKADAWKEMEEYNTQDVIVLEEVYEKLKPWIKSHPNHSIHDASSLVCPTCGGTHYNRRGFSFTTVGKYQRYQCSDCGSWFKSTQSLAPKAGNKFAPL